MICFFFSSRRRHTRCALVTGVQTCALPISLTVGVPHDTLGEIVVACIVPFENVSLDERTVRDFAKEKLASYKVPRRVLFFRDEELATTGSSKIKSGELRKLAAQRLAGSGD